MDQLIFGDNVLKFLIIYLYQLQFKKKYFEFMVDCHHKLNH